MTRSTISALLLLPWTVIGETIILPNTLYNGSVVPEAFSAAGDIDMPKVSPGINTTSYDWYDADSLRQENIRLTSCEGGILMWSLPMRPRPRP
jgi:hypothetical protein